MITTAEVLMVVPNRIRRHNARLRRRQEAASARGDDGARARWLLPRSDRYGGELWRNWWDGLRPWPHADSIAVSAETADGGVRHMAYRVPWRSAFTHVTPVAPVLATFPPAFEDRWSQLCPLYVPPRPVGGATGYERLARPVDRSDLAEESVPGAITRLAGDHDDVRRWVRAAGWYLTELNTIEYEIADYWATRGRRLPLTLPRPWAFRRWRAILGDGFDRAMAASDRYRPMFDEIQSAIAETASAYVELTARYQRLHEWESREVWQLLEWDDGLSACRTDVGGRDGTDGEPTRTLAEVAAAAHHQWNENLRPVDWHGGSVGRCDAELAELFDGHESIGRSRSGAPLAVFDLPSFRAWFSGRNGYDYATMADRQRLAIVAKARAMGRRRDPAGSWPTAEGVGDVGAGDYGGGSGSSSPHL